MNLLWGWSLQWMCDVAHIHNNVFHILSFHLIGQKGRKTLNISKIMKDMKHFSHRNILKFEWSFYTQMNVEVEKNIQKNSNFQYMFWLQSRDSLSSQTPMDLQAALKISVKWISLAKTCSQDEDVDYISLPEQWMDANNPYCCCNPSTLICNSDTHWRWQLPTAGKRNSTHFANFEIG